MKVGSMISRVTVLFAVIGALALAGAVTAAGASAAGTGTEQAAAGTAAAPNALDKARQAMQKARQALNKARFAVNQNRATRRTANRALAVANQATQAAQTAQQTANGAAQAAAKATQDAATALAAANRANDRLDDLAVASNEVTGSNSTTEELDYVSLGGPTVQATVPPSGLIEVWATVTFEDPADGLVALYEDGQRVVVEGQDGFCGSLNIDDSLLTASFPPGTSVTLSTPPGLALAGCGTVGAAAGPVMFERPPGPHTYELRYADCGCDPGPATFSGRTLRIAPRP